MRLVIGAALLDLFILALVGLALQQGHRQYVERAEITTRNLTQTLENEIAGALKADDIALLSLIDEYNRLRASGSVDARILRVYFERLQSRLPEIDALRIADTQGNVVYGRDVAPGAKANVADRPHFLRLRDDPLAGLVVSKPQVSRINQKWVIVFARRVDDSDGAFAGMAFAAITVDHFSRMFANLNVGKNGVVALRDEDFGLIARHPEFPGIGGKIGGNSLAKEIGNTIRAGQSAATLTARSLLDGFERTYSYRRIGAYPIYVFVGHATADYLAEWRANAKLHLALTAFFVLLTSLAAWLIYRFWIRQAGLIEALAGSEARLRATIDSALDAVVGMDSSGRITEFNPAAEKIFGWKKEEAVGQAMGDMLIPEQQRLAHRQGLDKYRHTRESHIMDQRMEITALRRDGTEFPVELTVTMVRQNDDDIFTAYVRDITERRQLEEQVKQLAFYDPLTGLPNRRLLHDRLSRTMAANKRSGCHGALLFIDLDNFKPLNDSHGHDVGDLLLIEVAKRLRTCVRETDTVSRFGGDEFVVMLSELPADRAESVSQTEVVAEKIRRRILEPYLLTAKRDGEKSVVIEHRCTGSIGVVLFIDHETNQTDIIKWADTAMYQAKNAGRNLIRFHDATA